MEKQNVRTIQYQYDFSVYNKNVIQKEKSMPLSENVKKAVYVYCNNHLADEEWYEEEFQFIEDIKLQKRLVEEFKGIRFAYKLYEGIEAVQENLVFEIRHQIIAYATIYEAVIHYVLYNYYGATTEFHDMQYHNAPAKISIPRGKLDKLSKELLHNGETIIPYHIQERKKEDAQIRFDDKCKTAEKLGLLHEYKNLDGVKIDIAKEIIEIYGYRNAIHLVAEQRKGIQYELDLSKLAYRRMRPFIDQIKDKLKADGKSIYKFSE